MGTGLHRDDLGTGRGNGNPSTNEEVALTPRHCMQAHDASVLPLPAHVMRRTHLILFEEMR